MLERYKLLETMTRTVYAPDQPPSLLARWASRLALFFTVVLPVAVVLHRLFGLPTPVALNIAAACFTGAALVLAMALVAGLDIWVTGRQGTARVVVAAVLALALLAIPIGVYVASLNWPELNDVTTNTKDPPAFVEAAMARGPAENPAQYPGGTFAALQAASYPDIKTLVVPRPADEVFELVLQAIGKLKMRSTFEAAPSDEARAPGIVEIADRTLMLGFTDDVVIQISGDEESSRIDVRSASRYGRSDFGRNAERVRSILKEIGNRLEASVPSADAAERAARKKEQGSAVKPQRVKRPASGALRPKQDPSRSGARRGPPRKAAPQE